MVKTCILFHVYVLILVLLFLIVEASSSNSNDKTSPNSLFVKHFLGSKRGDTVEGLGQVRKYLSKYGYLGPSMAGRYQRSPDTFNDSNVFDHDLRKGITKFQLFFNINVSGILDEETLSIMVKPRCSLPDLVNGTPIKHGIKLVRNPINSSYYEFLPSPKWSKFNLTWYKYSESRPESISPLTFAFKTWKDNSKFNFVRASSYGGSDVTIHFGNANTTNIRNFKDFSIAYTTNLPDPNIYFNVKIPWVVGDSPDGYDIETTAVHEIGHILGLAHTSVQEAVMFPTASMGKIKRNLHNDDIAGITALYP
ncbi:metalloendoproteinase 2-MMP-like [Impatiens glandulifera]|uniref:metalloendoproteinase 2-MMP-like n=1 Tax=Impatiens glandulifera TaxID=253017 RepID=UPI001FB0D8EB|nr:metalloendoproteinase 2-MMP-like [Impatiens glandulifera]